MFDISLFAKFKEVLEEFFGKDFFELDLIKTNSDLKKRYPRLSRTEPSLIEWTSHYCRDTYNISGQIYIIENEKLVPIQSIDPYCVPHDSYFACVLKPISPPLGTTYLLVVSKNGSTYNYKWTDYYYDGSVSATSLKGLLTEVPIRYSWSVSRDPSSNLFLKLKPLLEYDGEWEESQTDLLTIEDVYFLYSLKGHQTFNKHTLSSVKRIKSIGNKFPKGNYQYIYRALVNEILYNELEDSFQTSCSNTEEVLLEKDLSENAKRYFKVLVSGVKSWTSRKDHAERYRYPEDIVYGGSIMLIWVRPSQEDIALDVTPTIDYIREKHMEQQGSWAMYYEVLAEPKTSKIIGIKRIKNWKYCDYVIYIKS